ncbi:MAG: hypothetical protein P4L10_14815 [Acidobacteriaceae bacterium]|nr:hypothetical protein [Acidobacteriaceae bacterium]
MAVTKCACSIILVFILGLGNGNPILAQAKPAAEPETSQNLQARDELNKGVQAYKTAQYDEAINHFQRVVDLAPAHSIGYLYLGTACAQQVVPNVDTPENLQMAQRAIDNFQIVLKMKPNDTIALK